MLDIFEKGKFGLRDGRASAGDTPFVGVSCRRMSLVLDDGDDEYNLNAVVVDEGNHRNFAFRVLSC